MLLRNIWSVACNAKDKTAQLSAARSNGLPTDNNSSLGGVTVQRLLVVRCRDHEVGGVGKHGEAVQETVRRTHRLVILSTRRVRE